jgi:hypothetical protein
VPCQRCHHAAVLDVDDLDAGSWGQADGTICRRASSDQQRSLCFSFAKQRSHDAMQLCRDDGRLQRSDLWHPILRTADDGCGIWMYVQAGQASSVVRMALQVMRFGHTADEWQSANFNTHVTLSEHSHVVMHAAQTPRCTVSSSCCLRCHQPTACWGTSNLACAFQLHPPAPSPCTRPFWGSTPAARHHPHRRLSPLLCRRE